MSIAKTSAFDYHKVMDVLSKKRPAFFLGLFCLLAQPSFAVDDEADYHNVIRDALSTGQTLTNLGPALNQNYSFALENQPASPLAHLSLSSSLQTSAANYAAQCVFEHSGSSGLGENLFAGTGSWSFQQAINTWANEAQHLSYPVGSSTVSCQSGEQCGHYTQMVWSSTTQVGCAAQACAQISDDSGVIFSGQAGTLIACHYSPPGNVVLITGDLSAPYIGQSSSGGDDGDSSNGNNSSAIIPPILLLLLGD